MTQLKEWIREEVWAVIQLLWAQNMKPVNMNRQIVAVFGARAISNQQVQKWCCYFPNDQVIDTDRDRTGSLSHKTH